MGAAWESVDIFIALEEALYAEESMTMAYLAELRFKELRRNGKQSVHPDATHTEEDWFGRDRIAGGTRHTEDVESYFEQARKNAEEWHKHRLAFMNAKLEQGKHPDTDTGFWSDYVEIPPVPLPNNVLQRTKRSRNTFGQIE